MSWKNFFSIYSILMAALFIGLALAFALPWLANSQSLVGAQEYVLDINGAPDISARYYVAKTGDGSSGLEWSTAFTDVQQALGIALSGDEIWVAAGVYTPGEEIEDSFVLVNGAAMYGGFAGNEGAKTERNWSENLTVLSGDIDGDDTNLNGVVRDASHIAGDNANHVISATGVANNTILDGFTITGGQANQGSPDDSGGGFYCDGYGSGNKCSPSLSNIVFSGNLAAEYAGAMYNDSRQNGESKPRLFNVLFTGNSAFDGGAMYNEGSKGGDSSPIMRNVIFTGNSAKNGGALFNYGAEGSSSPEIINGLFSGNKAEFDGGAIQTSGFLGIAKPVYTNVTISGNRAQSGGGIYSSRSFETVRNSILWNNQDISGTGTISSTFYIFNTSISVTHSLVEGAGASGTGIWLSNPSFVDGGSNIDQDPKFVLPNDPSTAPNTTGDLRLQNVSPAIDKGFNGFIMDVPTDLDGDSRVVDGDSDGTPAVDMGAFEYQRPHPLAEYLPIVYR